MSKQARIQKEPHRLMANSPKLSLKIKMPNILQLLKNKSFKVRLFLKIAWWAQFMHSMSWEGATKIDDKISQKQVLK